MNEEPLATLLKTFPHTRYYSEWRLLTWHPRGLFDDALADKLIRVIGSEESVEEAPFHRYTDFSGLTHIRLKVGHVFQIAKQRSGAAESLGALIIRCHGVPIYRRLLMGVTNEQAGANVFLWASIGVTVIQVSYWIRLQCFPPPRFKRRLILGHAIQFLGRLSFVFIGGM